MNSKLKGINRHQVLASLDYRHPMPITELYIHWNGNGYYICPRCRVTLEREFTSYCDRCGQCLSWSQYQAATPIYTKQT